MLGRIVSNKPKLIILLAAIAIFCIASPLVLKINYVQNDEWVYFSMIRHFLTGDFKLDPLCAPTFYFQGFLATVFSLIFGIAKLPVLTLFVSVIDLVMFYLIVYEFYGKSILKSLLVSALLFFNPLHVYSALGFMTENYFLSATLVSIYFYLKFINKREPKHLTLFFVFSFLAFMVKQAALALPLSILIYAVLTRDNNTTIKVFGYLSGLSIFYFFIFPKTPEMVHKGLQFHHLIYFNYTYALIYGIFIMLVAFSLPLVLPRIAQFLRHFSLRQVALVLLLAVLLFFGLNKLFIPMTVSWGEFPYFENTFERGGLFPRNLDGTKYLYKFNYDLYKYWDICSKVLLTLLMSVGIFRIVSRAGSKLKLNLNDSRYLFAIYIFVYLILMDVAETFYDRYYFLLLIPFLLILLDSFVFDRLSRIITFGFVIFMIVLSYQFSMDFVLLNSTVWSRSQQLMDQKQVDAEFIKASKGWRHTYPSGLGILTPYKYVFSYDPTPPELFTTLPPIETEGIELTFPFSLWVNSKIYLLTYQYGN